MRIAICDDNALHVTSLRQAIVLWSHQTGNEVSVKAYPTAEQFLYHWLDDASFDLVFVDIELSDGNGMDLARAIRARNPSILIAFASALVEYAPAGYEVDAIRYLIKPVTNEDYYATLDKAQRILNERNLDILAVNANGKDVWLRLREVLYFSAFRHYLQAHCLDGMVTFRGNLSDLESRLPHPAFCRNHRTTIVNLRFVYTISPSEVQLNDSAQTVLPVSKKGWDELNRAFSTYHDAAAE